MAGALLVPPNGVPLERLVQVARERGFTAQGEMFSGELHSMTSKGLGEAMGAPCACLPPQHVGGWALEWGSPSLGPSTHLTVADMGKLAQEVLGCGTELLRGGLGPPNRDRVLQHLLAGHPLLIPYPRLGMGGGQREAGKKGGLRTVPQLCP